MNRRIINLTLTILVMTVGVVQQGCTTANGKYAHQIRDLEFASVTVDINAAISKNDFRFVAVMGYAMSVPGVPEYQEKYAAKYGVRVIENTSDVIESPEHARLQQVARDYAQRYNKLLLSKIPHP